MFRNIKSLSEQLHIGDIVFSRIDISLFKKLARDTGSWTNHVGIIVGFSGDQYLIAESVFPFSRITTLSRFVARSENGRFTVCRLKTAVSNQQQNHIIKAAQSRCGIFYDTGFNLYSRRQFCSRFVHEVIHEATGIKIGKITTFRELLKQNPSSDIRFWRIWYFGKIPWERETITPASLLESSELQKVFDGYA